MQLVLTLISAAIAEAVENPLGFGVKENTPISQLTI